MKEHFFSLKKIYYRTNEIKADRKTLIFIHGISGSSSAWLPYEKKFESNYNILSYDLRGHGKSWKPKNEEDYAIKKFAEDLFDLISFLKINKFILISHSFGTLIAMDFMTKHMGMLKKTIFISPNFAPKRIFSGKLIRPFLFFTHIFKILPFNQSGKGHVNYEKFKNTGDWNIPRMIADISITSLRVYLYGTKQSYYVDYEKFLPEINIPTLIIHGKKDSVFPINNAVMMNKKIKNSQLFIIENANHILVLNNFLEVSAEMERFISHASF